MNDAMIPEKAVPRTEEYGWQRERLKPSAERMPGASLHSGFGPNGKHSLYLPTPKMTRRVKFVDGKAQVEVEGNAGPFPEHILELRRRIISTGSVDDESATIADPFRRICFPDLVLIEYSAALLATQYNLSDADLEFIHSGDKWPEVILKHAIGGDKAILSLQNIDTSNAKAAADAIEAKATEFAIASASAEPVESSAGYFEELDATMAVKEAVSSNGVIGSSEGFDLSSD